MDVRILVDGLRSRCPYASFTYSSENGVWEVCGTRESKRFTSWLYDSDISQGKLEAMVLAFDYALKE